MQLQLKRSSHGVQQICNPKALCQIFCRLSHFFLGQGLGDCCNGGCPQTSPKKYFLKREFTKRGTKEARHMGTYSKYTHCEYIIQSKALRYSIGNTFRILVYYIAFPPPSIGGWDLRDFEMKCYFFGIISWDPQGHFYQCTIILVIRGNDKNKQLTLLSQRKLLLTGEKNTFA